MLTLVAGLALAQLSGVESVTLKVDGVDRQFYVYFPKTKDARPRPVVFAFHGHGGNSQYSVRKYHVNTLWPQAISIYPQGLPTIGALTDPDGKRNGWQKDVGDYNDRDLKFFDAMLKWVHGKAIVNDKAIFSLGHSNGGSFTYLLWKARPDVMRAIAPSGAGGASSRGTKPIPVFQTTGQNDPLVKFPLQKRAVEYVKKIDECEPTGKKLDDHMTRWDSKVGAPVVWYVFDGGHEYPEDALQKSVDFLKEYAKD